VPGPVAVRPVYAPALVAWVGGPNFGLSVSFGAGVAGVAWFPLGPREVYVPAYRASPTYINRVNVTNTTIVNNINITNINTANVRYVNREAPGAVTAVPQNVFAGARPVQGAAVPVRAEAIRSAQVVTTAPFAPSRQSVLGTSMPAGRVPQPPAATQNRPVFAKTAPPPAPVPFAQRQQALNANPGRPLDSTQVQQLRGGQAAPARPGVRTLPGASSPGGFNAQRPAGQATSPASGGQPGVTPGQPRDFRSTRPPSAQPQNQPAAGQAPANVSPRAPSQPAESTRPPRDFRSNPPAQNPPGGSASPRPPSQPTEPQPQARPSREAQPGNRPPTRGESRKEEKKEDRKEDRKQF